VPPADRNLWIALGASLFFHAVLLSLHFKFPEASRAFQDKALDIILVNSKAARKPTNAQALAQANLDGGGNTEQNRRAKTPLPPSARVQSGSELEQAQKRVQALEAQQQRLLALARSKETARLQTDKEAQPETAPSLSGRDLATRALEMARLEGEIDRQTDEYNKRPRVKNMGTRAEGVSYAQYSEDWRIKVERVGTLNYPEAAKGKLYGSLILSVRIKSDGSIDRVEINRSSGYKILDDAARRIVQMAAPFGAFTPDIRRDYDILEFTRSWTFTRNNQVETNSPR
jgi:protein TonB